MSQALFNQVGKNITEVTAQLNAGMITITEFLDFMVQQRINLGSNFSTVGLICPFTGMPYPTAEEIAAIDAFVDAV